MDRRKNWLVGTALFVITVLLYWPAISFPFVNYDDQLYVYENAEVLKGLSWSALVWSATSVVSANWHPLTVLSHLADCSLYGKFAGGHHLTSLLIHSINSVLLWLLLKRLTRWFWFSALVAALFAWHPLNVESVVWIAERKNVLSTFFFILTLWAYSSYATKPSGIRYTLTALLFILGLASKPMLVTLPFLLLLLDYWPLQRFSLEPPLGLKQRCIWLLVREKIPFLLISLVFCCVTFIVQNRAGAVKSLTDVPLNIRLLNIPVAYVNYGFKTLAPINLRVIYDFPENLLFLGVAASLLLGLITYLGWYWRFKFRWLLVGWLWFLVTLIPVIGLVQVGEQAMAERYAYLPLIGLFFIIAAGFRTYIFAKPQRRPVVVLLVIFILGICLMLSQRQLMLWKNSITLFSHAVKLNPDSALAHDLLATALSGNGRVPEAIEQYSQSVRLRPDRPEAQYNLGREEIEAGKFMEAEAHLNAALLKSPSNPIYHNTRGVALLQGGRAQEAEKEFRLTIELQREYAKPYFNLGKILMAEGQTAAAITNYAMAVQLQPDWVEALENLASAHATNGDFTSAIATANAALTVALTSQPPGLTNQIIAEITSYQKALGQLPRIISP